MGLLGWLGWLGLLAQGNCWPLIGKWNLLLSIQMEHYRRYIRRWLHKEWIWGISTFEYLCSRCEILRISVCRLFRRSSIQMVQGTWHIRSPSRLGMLLGNCMIFGLRSKRSLRGTCWLVQGFQLFRTCGCRSWVWCRLGRKCSPFCKDQRLEWGHYMRRIWNLRLWRKECQWGI